MKIEITSRLYIYEYELEEKFVRASGPGGQKVNKTSSAVHLFFKISENSTLPAYVKKNLLEMSGKKVSSDGVLTIKAMRYKSLDKNRDDALERLKKIIRDAARKQKVRKETKPSKQSREKRMKEKKMKSELKKLRQKKMPEEI